MMDGGLERSGGVLVQPGVSAGALAQALMNAERRFHALAETSLQGLLVHRRYRPLYANTAFAYLAGCDRADEVVGRADILAFLDEETRTDPEGAWVRMLHGPAIFGRRTMHRSDGSQYCAEIYARTIEWDGAPAIAIAISDVSEEERARQRMADAQEVAEAATRAKRRFLAAAGHDLRTPLQNALGALQLLAEAQLPHQSNILARDALDACRDLARRVDDILDAAAFDAQALTLSNEPFWLKQIVEAALADVAVGADAAGVRIAAPIIDAGARVMGDPRAVRRIAAALLEACIRRLPSRCVSIEAQTEAAGLVIAVRGEGLLRVPSEDDEDGSPFLPLATARRLTEAHNGVLVEWAETPTLWSASAYLPLERLDGSPEQPLSRRLDVLAVEDNAGARALLRVAIEALGHRPTLCASGADALEMLQQRGFDVILMDLSMPGLSGCDTARRIRALPLPWAQAPIAALTAASTPGVREEIAEAGMDAFLRKPIDIPQLAETLALLAERSVQAAETHQVQTKDKHQEAEDQQNRRGGEERNDLFHADSDSMRRAAL